MLGYCPQHQPAQQRAGRHVDKMVLVSRQYRQSNQALPQQNRQSDFGKPRPIKRADNDRQRDMQRRCLVVRQVKRYQRIKKPTPQPVGRRLRPAEMQRKQHKASSGNNLRRYQPCDIAVLFTRILAKEKCRSIHQVQRPIRHNRPRPKRNVALPRKSDFRYIGQRCRVTVGQAVAGVEQCADQGKLA